ncbi:hypothetical protein [Terasakiella sp.]|uniref:DUF7674 family protein n=1 Tax=Terasakiella sp. TaxID=2034861 RepID=UPI003AA9C97D
MSAINISFCCHLAFIFPELLSLLEEHLKDNTGEILPHLLMYDYCQLVSNDLGNRPWHKELLHTLEKIYSETDDDISNLIAVSFIESIHFTNDLDNKYTSLLGPKLLKHYNLVFKGYKT